MFVLLLAFLGGLWSDDDDDDPPPSPHPPPQLFSSPFSPNLFSFGICATIRPH